MILVYRELDLQAFVRTVLDCALLAGMVLFILAAASGFSWALTVAHLPQRLVDLLQASRQHGVVPARFDRAADRGRLAAGRASGAYYPGAAAAADRRQIGFSELHYGIVLLIAMGIGAFLPPPASASTSPAPSCAPISRAPRAPWCPISWC